MTSRLGTGKRPTLFYSVASKSVVFTYSFDGLPQRVLNVYRGLVFLAVIILVRLPPPLLPPPPSSQHGVSFSQSSCVSPVELTDERGGRGGRGAKS